MLLLACPARENEKGDEKGGQTNPHPQTPHPRALEVRLLRDNSDNNDNDDISDISNMNNNDTNNKTTITNNTISNDTNSCTST